MPLGAAGHFYIEETSMKRKNRPVIGIIPLFDIQRDSIWMVPGYQEMLENAGAVPFIIPYTSSDSVIEEICGLCDGFLFTGGQDVNPAVYGERMMEECGEILPLRDEMEEKYLRYCIDNDAPALGICRGIQFFNACLGGTLYQDLPSQKGVNHVQSPPYDRPFHEVKVKKGSLLHEITGKDTLSVNSYHHQAVKKPAGQLEVTALSEDGTVEAMEMKDKAFILAVQWHPELNYRTDANSRKLISCFVYRCRQTK